ncbi:MAG: hypothetical protein AB7L09_22035 [Nitrospira sp.]
MSNADRAATIAKLLATAESFAREGNETTAQAYIDRASQLQLKYMIEDSDIRQAAGKDRVEEKLVSVRVRGVDKGSQFIKARRELVTGLAFVFHCQITLTTDRARMSLWGYESDVQFVQTLFNSLSIQMISLMDDDVRRTYRRPVDRSWRTSFAHGYARRVYARLKASRAAQETEAGTTTPGASLVLRSRSEAVQAWFGQQAGLRRGSVYKNTSTRSADGYYAGQAAGDRADIGNVRVGGGAKGQLT